MNVKLPPLLRPSLFLLSLRPLSISSYAYIGLGSNIPPRFANVKSAISRLSRIGKIIDESGFYETEPMYVTDQDKFVNAVVKVEVDASLEVAVEAMKKAKDIEREVGRRVTYRNGPRVVDVDLLTIGNIKVDVDDVNGGVADNIINSNDNDDDNDDIDDIDDIDDDIGTPIPMPLKVPHPSMLSRNFVMRPLSDVSDGDRRDRDRGEGKCVRVVDCGEGRVLRFDRPLVMGILNSTPDSFSSPSPSPSSPSSPSELDLLEEAKRMVRAGASIIDVGGESTRPGAACVSVEDEISRTVGVVELLRKRLPKETIISIDTRKSAVARAAVSAGADIVNDVSGGRHDELMHSTVAELGVPYVITHSRGDPTNMSEMCDYEDAFEDVCEELRGMSDLASSRGVKKYNQIVDPGIGFAKTPSQSLEIINEGTRRLSEKVYNLPVLWGLSRKGFIGEITGVPPSSRDSGTAAANLSAMSLNCEIETGYVEPVIFRVHDVRVTKDAIDVFRAVRGVGEFTRLTKPEPKGEDGASSTSSTKSSRVSVSGSTVAPHSSAAANSSRKEFHGDPLAKRPNKVCDPYEQGGKPLAEPQVSRLLKTISRDWVVSSDFGTLTRSFDCGSRYLDSVSLLKSLSSVCYNNDHYPSLALSRTLNRRSWSNSVVVTMRTELLGGLSYRDFEIAMYIDLEYERYEEGRKRAK